MASRLEFGWRAVGTGQVGRNSSTAPRSIAAKAAFVNGDIRTL